MALTARNVLDYATSHRLGGPASAYVPDIDIVNRALFEFAGSRKWKCLERSKSYLVARPNITATGWAYTASTGILSNLAGSELANYTVVPGDVITVTTSNGAGVKVGPYTVLTKVAGLNAVTIEGGGAADLTDLQVELDGSRVALPSNFDSLMHVQTSDSLNGQVRLVGPAELLDYRSVSTPQSAYTTWMALAYNQLGAGTEPTPVLEIWPPPSDLDAFEFVLAYRVTPEPVEDDDDLITLPAFTHGLILDLAAAIAQGMEAKEDIGLYVSQVRQGGVYRRTVRQDKTQQARTGKPRNGAYGPGEPDLTFSEALTRAARFSID